MGFKSYAAHPQADGTLLLDDQQPLMFSGRKGLIAKFVLEDGQGTEDHWRLCPGELHALALPSLQTGERVIVFEQVQDAEREVLLLEAVNGVSGRTTEMMFSFRPLQVVGENPRLRVCATPDRKTYNEDLALDGGRDDRSGSWRWRKPHLAIGAVVLGPNTPCGV